MPEAEDIMRLLLPGAGGTSKPWYEYGGIQPGGSTLLQRTRGFVTKGATSLFGPVIGSLVGPFAADYLVGRQFNKYGQLGNRLAGLLAPQTGTYAGAYQDFRQRQALAALKQDRQTQGKNLKHAAAAAYFKMTSPETWEIDLHNAKVSGNPLTLQKAVNYFLDPTEYRKSQKGLEDTQAGVMYWAQRRMGVTGGYHQGIRRAQRIGATVANMSIQATQAVSGDFSKAKYAGFKGGAVAQLASILANQADVIGQNGTDIDKAMDRFKQSVQKTAKALAPLKDIFGQDVKAMTDMIQAVSGQRVSQLGPALTSSIATNIADMSRYSGATVKQIQALGGQVLNLSMGMGNTNSFSLIGAANQGSLMAGLLTQGNAPAGVYAGMYASDSKRALAGANAAKGHEYLAMAYSIWKNKKGNENGTIQEFIAKVREQGGDVIHGAMAVAGVQSQQGLMQGMGYTEYRTSLQSGQLTSLQLQGQFQEALAQNLYSIKDTIGIDQTNKLYSVFMNAENAGAIKDLLANSNDKEYVISWAKKMGLDPKALNLTLAKGAPFLNAVKRRVNVLQIQKFKKQQANLRAKYSKMQGISGNRWDTLLRAAANGTIEEKDIATINQMVQHTVGLKQGQGEKLRKAVMDQKSGFGAKLGSQILSNAIQGDQAAKASLRVLNDPKASEKDKQKAKKTLVASTVLNMKDKKISELVTGQGKYSTMTQDILQQYKQGKLDKNQTRKKIDGILRRRRMDELGDQGLGIKKGKGIANKQRNLLYSNADKTAQQFQKSLTEQAAKSAGFESKQAAVKAFKRSQEGYDLQTDLFKRIASLLQTILDWLKKDPKGGLG